MPLAPTQTAAPNEDALELAANAARASEFLKSLSHPTRLMILCHLAMGPRSVTELLTILGARQAAVSQQLSRLRADGLVTSDRQGKTVFYTLSDPRAKPIIEALYAAFCA